MQHQALYRKWRPQTFEDVYGQEHITSVLKYETKNNAFSHAYLFCGSRGTGKTTCAKILSRAVNCQSPIDGSPCGECASCRAILDATTTDVIEMDAASNNGVDNIRDIRDEVIYAPSVLKYRVYIIDEVHMLSASAFNALLKTLEEPPAHVVFILATTELNKLPATIISRCQRFDFRRISVPILTERIELIAKEEGIELDHEAAILIAKQAQGGMRDAISLLELCAGSRKRITVELVNESVGSVGREDVCKLAQAIVRRDYDAVFSAVASVVSSARDLSVFWQDIISLYRDMLVVKASSKPTEYLDLTENEYARMRELASAFSKEKLVYHISVLNDAFVLMQGAKSAKRLIAETALVKLCDETLSNSNEALLLRVAELEDRINSGAVSVEKRETEPTPKEEKSDEPKVEKKSADIIKGIKSVSQRTAPTPKSAGGLKPFREFAEVIERVGRQDGMVASFLKGAKAYTDGERVVIRVEKDFTLMMLDKGNGKDIVRGAISAQLKRNVDERCIVYECSAEKIEDDDSGFDDITNAIN